MINSEDDLWQLFGGDAPNAQGKNELTFAEFHNQTAKLDVSAKKQSDLLRPRFGVTAKNEFYRLRSSDVEAVVNQARLYATAGKIGDPELSVAYLGIRDERPTPDIGAKAAPRTKATDYKKRRGKSTPSAKRQTKEDPNVGDYLLLVEKLGTIINPKFWTADGEEVRRSQVSHWMGVSIKCYTDNELRTMNKEALQALHQCALELEANEDLAPQLERIKDTLRKRGVEPNTACDVHRLLELLREKVAHRPEELYRGLRKT